MSELRRPQPSGMQQICSFSFILCQSDFQLTLLILDVKSSNASPFYYPGSVVSMVMGLVFGGISGVGAYQMSKNPANYHLLMGR